MAYIDLDVTVGPDGSESRVLGVEFSWPVSDGDRFGLHVTDWHRGDRPDRTALVVALAEVVEMATYGIEMLMMRAEGQEKALDELEGAVERQREEAEHAGQDGYVCDDCPDEGECPTCAADSQADVDRERGKLAALEQELETLHAGFRASEDRAIAGAKKVARYAALGDRDPVTAPVTRACESCGGPIASPRPEARFCSGRCRVAAHRARRVRPAV